MTPTKKPSEILREKLAKRAQDQLALINKIFYQLDPKHEDFIDEIPLYCSCHSTEEGRHSATRTLRRA
jgi:hypothetical protein